MKLLLNNDKIPCNEEDIGVITPYRKQVEKMRMMFKALNVARVKVNFPKIKTRNKNLFYLLPV